MNNAELIAGLRWCADKSICCDDFSGEKCPCFDEKKGSCSADEILHAAADALEAQEKALEECARQLAELSAKVTKEGEWIWENYCWHCSVCGENPTRGMGYVQGKNELFRVCPKCGAKMQTVTDCHTFKKGANDEH